MSVQDYLLYSKDGTLHGRMMALMQEIKVCDVTSERGNRSVWTGLQTSLGSKLFTDFLFTPKQDVLCLLNAAPVLNDLAGMCTFSTVPHQERGFRKSATQLIFTYVVVDYDPEHVTFKPYVAEEFTVAKTDEPTALINFVLTDLPPTYTFRMAFLAVEFYESCNGKLVALKEQGMTGLRCLGIWF